MNQSLLPFEMSKIRTLPIRILKWLAGGGSSLGGLSAARISLMASLTLGRMMLAASLTLGRMMLAASLTLGRMMLAASLTLGLSACENPIKKAVREGTYSAYEMVGIQKRDLLKKRITETQSEQKEASESFTDALDKLQKMYNLDGGKLESQYRQVKSSFDDSKEKAVEVKNSRQKMETVANDLFKEWEGEIDEIKTQDFKSRSRAKLRETKTKFEALNRNLVQSEKKMDPVLARLNDHVLFLKHNLNAQSIAQLKTENTRIESEIQGLIKDMNRSIGQADAFIKTIE